MRRVDWSTPKTLFDGLNRDYGPFTLDVAANYLNTKCRSYFSEGDDGLKQAWSGRCWMNPPYGRQVAKWVKKAHDEIEAGNCDLIVALLPASTDTIWFHDYVMRAHEFQFLKGRLHFNDGKGRCPFGSMIVVWRRKA